MAFSETTTTATPIESSVSAVSWASIFAGAAAAASLTLVLLLLGSGLGMTMVSPWSGESSSAATIGISAAVWLVVVQWLSSALGGYLTGRLRTKWVGVHTDEVYFRDTAHGFLAWAVATVFVVGLLSSGVGAVASTAAQSVGLAVGAGGTAAVSAASDNSDGTTSYFTDALLRPADPGVSPANQTDEAVASQVSRVLLNGAAAGQMPEDDKTYLAKVVAARTGLSEADAQARVNTVLQQVEDAKVKAQEAIDTARKAAATTALIGALSLFVGAFIAAVAAALAGRQRDDEPDVALRR